MAITAVSAAPPARPVAPPEASAGAGDASSFADLLGQNREACRANTEAPADEAADPSSVQTPAQTPAHAARRAERAPTAHRGERAAVAKPGPTEDKVPKAATPDDADTPVDPALAPWMLALHTGAAAPAPQAASMRAGTDTSVASTASLQSRAAPAGTAAQPAATPEAAGDARPDTTAALQAEPPPRFEAVAADLSREAPGAPGPAGERAHEPRTERSTGAETLATIAPGAAPQRLAEPAAAAAPAATVSAPIESPEFAGALSVQVSVFAREGVHQAELQINPIEMGPVSVQIALDGNQARVHFGAEVAATRQAIEASLPELAAALRDAGFTLSGGGVSQQRSGRGEAGDGGPNDGSTDGRRGSRRIEGGGAAQSVTLGPLQRRVASGGVDLYA